MHFQPKMYNQLYKEISLKVYNMHLYYDHTVYSFPLYTFLWPELVQSGRNMSSA